MCNGRGLGLQFQAIQGELAAVGGVGAGGAAGVGAVGGGRVLGGVRVRLGEQGRERERERVNGGNVKIRVYKLSAMRHKIITGKIHSIIN